MTYISNKDVQEAPNALQLCAGQTAGAKRFIHTKQYVNQQDKTEAILLVKNTFNCVNRKVMLPFYALLFRAATLCQQDYSSEEIK